MRIALILLALAHLRVWYMPGKRSCYNVAFSALSTRQWRRLQRDVYYSRQAVPAVPISRQDVSAIAAISRGRELHRQLNHSNGHKANHLRDAALASFRNGKCDREELQRYEAIDRKANRAKHDTDFGISLPYSPSSDDFPLLSGSLPPKRGACGSKSWADITESDDQSLEDVLHTTPELTSKACHSQSSAGIVDFGKAAEQSSCQGGDEEQPDKYGNEKCSQSFYRGGCLPAAGWTLACYGSQTLPNSSSSFSSPEANAEYWRVQVADLRHENAALFSAKEALSAQLVEAESALRVWSNHASWLESQNRELQAFLVCGHLPQPSLASLGLGRDPPASPAPLETPVLAQNARWSKNQSCFSGFQNFSLNQNSLLQNPVQNFSGDFGAGEAQVDGEKKHADDGLHLIKESLNALVMRTEDAEKRLDKLAATMHNETVFFHTAPAFDQVPNVSENKTGEFGQLQCSSGSELASAALPFSLTRDHLRCGSGSELTQQLMDLKAELQECGASFESKLHSAVESLKEEWAALKEHGFIGNKNDNVFVSRLQSVFESKLHSAVEPLKEELAALQKRVSHSQAGPSEKEFAASLEHVQQPDVFTQDGSFASSPDLHIRGNGIANAAKDGAEDTWPLPRTGHVRDLQAIFERLMCVSTLDARRENAEPTALQNNDPDDPWVSFDGEELLPSPTKDHLHEMLDSDPKSRKKVPKNLDFGIAYDGEPEEQITRENLPKTELNAEPTALQNRHQACKKETILVKTGEAKVPLVDMGIYRSNSVHFEPGGDDASTFKHRRYFRDFADSLEDSEDGQTETESLILTKQFVDAGYDPENQLDFEDRFEDDEGKCIDESDEAYNAYCRHYVPSGEPWV